MAKPARKGRKALTEAEKAERAAAKEKANAERKAMLANMSDAEKAAFRAKEKRTNFIKVANARIPKAVKALTVLGNLANKSTYSFTADDVKIMADKIDAAYNAVFGRFKIALEGGATTETTEAPLFTE